MKGQTPGTVFVIKEILFVGAVGGFLLQEEKTVGKCPRYVKKLKIVEICEDNKHLYYIF